MNGTRVIGPSLAGVFIGIAVIGVGGVYYMTTIGFVIAMLSMVRLPPGEPRADARRAPALHDLDDGLRYVTGRPQIFTLLLASFLVVMIGFPYQSFLPSLVKADLDAGANALGAMSSIGAVGAVLATVFVAAIATSRRVWTLQPAAGAVFGLSVVALGLAPNLPVALAVMFIVGGAASAFQSLNNSLTMSLAEQQYHGRVMSLSSLSWSFFGLIALPLGFLADAIGLRETLVVMGSLSVVSIVFVELVGHARHASSDRIEHVARPREQAAPATTGGQ
jgi:predicted MFS family arabinose efflux permease